MSAKLGASKARVVAALALVVVAGLVYLASRLGPDAPTLSEALVRHTLRSELAADVEWDEIELSFDPPSVALSGARAIWSGELQAIARSARVVLQFDPDLLEVGRFELVSARFEELSVALSGVLPADRPLAFRRLEVVRVASESAVGASSSPTLSVALTGRGEFEAGGSLGFEVRNADADLHPVDLHFADVPAAEWAIFAPELRDASGTISGWLEIELRNDSDESLSAGETLASTASIYGRFEIDAARAGLSIAGAYHKPVGDPATLSGRFRHSPQGEFELLEVHLSIRKAGVEATNDES